MYYTHCPKRDRDHKSQRWSESPLLRHMIQHKAYMLYLYSMDSLSLSRFLFSCHQSKGITVYCHSIQQQSSTWTFFLFFFSGHPANICIFTMIYLYIIECNAIVFDLYSFRRLYSIWDWKDISIFRFKQKCFSRGWVGIMAPWWMIGSRFPLFWNPPFFIDCVGNAAFDFSILIIFVCI